MKLLFILGRGRSGTTLLSKILNAHDQLAVAPEGFFALSLMNKYQHASWTNKTLEAFLEDLELEARMQTWELDRQALRAELQQYQQLNYQQVCRTVYQHYARKVGKPAPLWMGDKNPHYALFATRLLKRFPESRAIILTRDHRDNLLSYQRVPFDSNKAGELAYRWHYYNKCLENTSKQFPERTYRLKYEDLTTAPEATLQGICAYLGVPYQSAMLHFYQQSQDPAFYGSQYTWFKETRQSISTKHQGKWTEAMKAEDLWLAEELCQPLAQQLGYSRTTPFAPGMKLKATKLLSQARGWLRTQLEILLFTACPLKLRTFVINRYRSSTGRT